MMTLRATRGDSAGFSGSLAAALAACSRSIDLRTARRGEVGGKLGKCDAGTRADAARVSTRYKAPSW
jgi:hypothetical protein